MRIMLGIIAAAGRSDTHNGHHCFNGLKLGICYIGGNTRGPNYWNTQCLHKRKIQHILRWKHECLQECHRSVREFAALFGYHSHMFHMRCFDLVSVSEMHLLVFRHIRILLSNLFILKPDLSMWWWNGYWATRRKRCRSQGNPDIARKWQPDGLEGTTVGHRGQSETRSNAEVHLEESCQSRRWHFNKIHSCNIYIYICEPHSKKGCKPWGTVGHRQVLEWWPNIGIRPQMRYS